MYVRTTQRRNNDGSVVRYVALAHNRRDGATTKAEVLVNLGREDRLDMDGLRRLAGSICRYPGDEQPAVDDQLRLPDVDGLDVVASRPLGTVWLLDGCGGGWGSPTPCAPRWGVGGSPRMWSGCCSRWWRTGRSRRARNSMLNAVVTRTGL